MVLYLKSLEHLLLGREKVIPNMFGYILPAIKETSTSKYLITYLERHIDIDGDRHGPLSMKLLMLLVIKNNYLLLTRQP